MRRKRIRILLTVLLTGSMLVSGCGQSIEDKTKFMHKPLKFGATYMTMNNPYFETMDASIKEVVEGNGDILITRDPLQDAEKQNEQIEEMIEEGVAAIFFNPVDWKATMPAIKRCYEEGIPVFNIDTEVYESDYVVCSVLSDNYDAGVQIAKDMMKKKESADIVIINHKNINSTNLRVQGFLDTIKDKPQYRVVHQRKTTAEFEVAMEEMNKILDTRIDFDVAFGGNDPTALGMLAAMQQRHWEKEGMLLYGVDGSPDGKAMIKAGYMEGTSAQSPKQIGKLAAKAAYKYLSGTDVKDITVKVTLITKDNLKNYDVSGWQ